jgi:hypothetical protein
MDDNDKTTSTAESGEGALTGAAKIIGSAIGKVTAVASGKTGKTGKTGQAKPAAKQKENLFQAEYLGSGTFKITKPKRTKAKRRQSALKNRRRGSRK